MATSAPSPILASREALRATVAAVTSAPDRIAASLGLAREADDTWSIGHALANLGTIAFRQGKLDRAVELLEESLAIKRGIRDGSTIPYLLTSLGEVEAARGNLPLAIEHLAEAIPMILALGGRASLTDAAVGLAAVAERAGAPLVAARLLGAAEAAREELGIQRTDLDRQDFAARIPRLRAAVGSERFEGAWAAGRSGGVEAAVRAGLDAISA